MQDVEGTIVDIIGKYTEEELRKESVSLIDDLKMDSLCLVEILAEIEQKFDISFEEGENLLELVDNLESMIQYVEGIVRNRER